MYTHTHTQEEVQPGTLECFMYSSNLSCFRLSGVQKLNRRKKATTAFCIGLHLGLVVVLDSDDFVSFSFAFFTSVVFSHLIPASCIMSQISIHGSSGTLSIRSHNSGEAMAPHSSTLAWGIPWTEEPSGLQSMGSLVVLVIRLVSFL